MSGAAPEDYLRKHPARAEVSALDQGYTRLEASSRFVRGEHPIEMLQVSVQPIAPEDHIGRLSTVYSMPHAKGAYQSKDFAVVFSIT